MFQLSA